MTQATAMKGYRKALKEADVHTCEIARRKFPIELTLKRSLEAGFELGTIRLHDGKAWLPVWDDECRNMANLALTDEESLRYIDGALV